MNKKAQVVETVGAIVLLIGSIIGVLEVVKDISPNQYIADISTKGTNKPCVYEVSCEAKINEIATENRQPYKTLPEANNGGYTLCSCD